MLSGTNFLRTDLSGVDFTATSLRGVIFNGSDLTNSNFEGVNLSPEQTYFTTFENKAYLHTTQWNDATALGSGAGSILVGELFGELSAYNVRILSTKVSGNDLDVEYFYFNNFVSANLENANFKNAILWVTKFSSANLSNADLSGAELKMALFTNADLSNANLQGADLTGADFTGANLSYASYDQNTIRNCIGHSICVN